MATSNQSSLGERAQRYLFSTKNIAGSAAALAGLILFFTGVIGAIWPVVVLGLYAAGALAAPADRQIDLLGGLDTADLRRALDSLNRRIAGQLPDDIMSRVKRIEGTIADLIPKIEHLSAGDPSVQIVARTATDYLPSTLQAYLNLPRGYAMVRAVANGKTATQVLADQLDLLESQMDKVADAIAKSDSDQLVANGRFLAEKFGGSTLSLPEQSGGPPQSK